MALRGYCVKITASAMRGALGVAFAATHSNAVLAFLIFSGMLAFFAIVQFMFAAILWRMNRRQRAVAHVGDEARQPLLSTSPPGYPDALGVSTPSGPHEHFVSRVV